MSHSYFRVLTGASCAVFLLAGCGVSETAGTADQAGSILPTAPEELAFTADDTSPIPEVEESAPPAPEVNDGFSSGQKNAVRSAEGYLEFSSFSCQGMIDQLSSEYGDGYTLEEATHGANNSSAC